MKKLVNGIAEVSQLPASVTYVEGIGPTFAMEQKESTKVTKPKKSKMPVKEVKVEETVEEYDTYTPVVLTGKFGKFKSRAADVQLYDKYIVLVYGGEPGDDELYFEPPLGESFTVTVEIGDENKGSTESFSVKHLGLNIKFNATTNLVVLIKVPEEVDDN